jgi:demethylmenaquinone methyltransferase/2-methoxy-6-polyprenyl-1,4-benzoquinol methylase
MNRSKAPGTHVRGMFARIAPTYDLLNHLLSVGRDRVWRRALTTSLPSTALHVLDLCSGTGDLALEIAARRDGTHVVSGDFCLEMLLAGASKGLPERTTPAVCDALQLPFADGAFDAVTVAFGVRNFESLDRGLAEMRRVLQAGGTLAVLEFFRSEARWRELPMRFYLHNVLPRVGRLVSHDREAYTYLPESVGGFVTRTEFEDLLRVHGFADVRRRDMTFRVATLFLARAT